MALPHPPRTKTGRASKLPFSVILNKVRVRADQRMARPAAVGARLPVPVRGRYVAQAHLGVGREHQHPSRGRRGRHRSPQGHRRRGGHRRVNHLSARRIPCRAPAADPHQQHDRTAQPRDPQEDTRRRQLPDGRSALMLIYAHIRYVTASQWSTHRYLDVSRLDGTMQSTHRDHVRRRVDHIRARHWAQPKRINELIQMNI